MTDIICTDANHAHRFAEHGWAAVLGVTDLPTSPPDVLCAACAAHQVPATDLLPEPDQAEQIVALKAVVDELLALIAGE